MSKSHAFVLAPANEPTIEESAAEDVPTEEWNVPSSRRRASVALPATTSASVDADENSAISVGELAMEMVDGHSISVVGQLSLPLSTLMGTLTVMTSGPVSMA